MRTKRKRNNSSKGFFWGCIGACWISMGILWSWAYLSSTKATAFGIRYWGKYLQWHSCDWIAKKLVVFLLVFLSHVYSLNTRVYRPESPPHWQWDRKERDFVNEKFLRFYCTVRMSLDVLLQNSIALSCLLLSAKQNDVDRHFPRVTMGLVSRPFVRQYNRVRVYETRRCWLHVPFYYSFHWLSKLPHQTERPRIMFAFVSKSLRPFLSFSLFDTFIHVKIHVCIKSTTRGKRVWTNVSVRYNTWDRTVEWQNRWIDRHTSF